MKQVMIVRNDLKLSKGKTAAQCCHACLGSYRKADPEKIRKWSNDGEKKVIVKVNSLEELFEIKEIAKKNNIPNYLVKDAGRTEIPRGTFTCLGLGPDEDEIIDKVTNDLKLLG
ncbi:peptidyl-tRNA hydrolase [Methanobrevibacter cuticularis]|uniref:Peptidyl-tRNA hydrolase n=1 Tax=Methanobrevibacter cuticularis TaxID=47311 RepID=A0A166ERB6_9EURY|nr:aminoacyl-tRNA hydrolase [Methanobrevibacter cuticularis]KZX16925.1 peptidyl-tRNA hydrolase [Methanobrevibacter cuticularis]